MLPPPPPEKPLDRHLKRDAALTDPKQPLILCIPGTETYIKLTRHPPSDGLDGDKAFINDQGQMSSLVANTWTWITREHLPPKGKDGIIDKGEGWIVERKSTHGTHKLLVANAHHAVPVGRWSPNGLGTMKIVGNEITWGVLRAALTGLGEFSARHGWTVCEFEIWDGRNQAGTAKLLA
ncbi:MAG: hypothetical protein L6R38_006876 [Xanthoria sp. 2 TBL-2021]|nr:MAG: hypothetical protein L6R38_006876 [Xanthoria sp. 2 TBL-2021]